MWLICIMFEYLSKYLYVLKNRNRSLVLLLMLFVISSVFDLIGIGLIAPYIKIVNHPADMERFSFWLKIRHFVGGSNQNMILILGLIIALSFFIRAGVSYKVQKSIVKFTFGVTAGLIERLMDTYQAMPYEFHIQRNSSSLIQVMIDHTNTYKEMTLLSSLRFISEGVVVLVIFMLLAIVNWQATFSMLAMLSIVFFLYDYFVKSKFDEAGKTVLKSSEKVIKWVGQALSGFKEIHMLNQEKFFHKQVSDEAHLYANSASLAQALQTMPRYLMECALITVVVGLVSASIIFLGTAKDIIPILGMFAVASFRLIPSANKMSIGFTCMRYSKQALYDLYEDLTELNSWRESLQLVDNEALSPERHFQGFRCINVNKITYRYPGSEKSSIEDCSLCVKRGECVALIGESGSGKSTFVDLLLGLLSPSNGAVEVDDVDILRDIRSWQNLIAYIPQEIFIIDDTLVKNIILGLNFDKEKFAEVLKMAQLERAVNRLPEGANTILGERGVLLSGGERQRIALARAFYHDREIIVMDEATAALDEATERKVVSSIMSLKGKKTIFIIAHRLSILENCDKVYRFNAGKIVEAGSYAEVVA